MSGRSQNLGSNNEVTSENRRMNEYTMTLTRNHAGPSSDPQVRHASSKTMLSRRDKVDDEHVLRGAEILRAQLLAATKQRIDQQMKNPLLRSTKVEQQQQPSRKKFDAQALNGELHDGETCEAVAGKISRKNRQIHTNNYSSGKDGAFEDLQNGQGIQDSTGAIADLCISNLISNHYEFQAKIKPKGKNSTVLITNITSASKVVFHNGATIEHTDTLSSSTEDFLNVLSPSHARIPLASIEQYNTSCESVPSCRATEKSIMLSTAEQQEKKEISLRSNICMNNSNEDNAYRHAQMAGLLWQTLVGEQVRFPKTWYNGQRSRPMMSDSMTSSSWLYVSKHRVRANPFLNHLIQSPNPAKKNAPKGRLILHLLIQNEMTLKHIQDVVVGCFHPKYVRNDSKGDKTLSNIEEDSRDIWLAVRKVGNNHSLEQSNVDTTSLLDSILCVDTKWKNNNKNLGKKSPIGDQKGLVTNDNVAAIYGDKPPLKTVVVNERVAYTLVRSAQESSSIESSNPASILLLQEFLFKRIHYQVKQL